MKIYIFILLFSFLFGGESINILTGIESGTYHKMATDIQKISKKKILINVIETEGSLYNIDMLYKNNSSLQLGIVQYDALFYIRDVLKIKNLGDKIKMLSPLYNEEIHIIVRKDKNIQNIMDLTNKKVNVDKKLSGSWITAQIIKRKHNIDWIEYNLGLQKALIKLIKNEIDALIYVGGMPVPLLAKLPQSSKEIIKLISPKLDGYYLTSKITKNTYSWLDYSFNTNATKALLVTFNYKSRLRNQQIKYFIDMFTKNLKKLKTQGHIKWKEVYLKKRNKIWPLYKIKSFNMGKVTNNSLEEEAKKIVKDFYRKEMKSSTPIEFINSFYYPVKAYFGKKNVSKKDIFEDKKKYFDVWPFREYRDIKIKTLKTNPLTLKIVFSFNLRNKKNHRTLEGISRHLITFKHINGKLLIERIRVIRKKN